MKIAAVLTLSMTLVSSVWSQSFRKEHVAADAQWVAHINVDRLFKTKTGDFLARKMDEGDANHQLAAFRAMFQIDPKKDIANVTLYGGAAAPENGVAIVQGQFNRQHITTLLKAMKGYREHTHNKTVIHQWPADQDKQAEATNGDNGQIYAAFQSDRVLAMGKDVTSVENALDVLNRAKPSLSHSEILQVMSRDSQDVYLRMTADLSDMKKPAPAQGPDIRGQIKTLGMTLGESLDTLNLHLELGSISAEAARQMHSMAQGFLAMAQMQQAENPDMAKLMQALSLTLDGSTIRATLKIPVADAIEAMEKQRRAGAVIQAE